MDIFDELKENGYEFEYVDNLTILRKNGIDVLYSNFWQRFPEFTLEEVERLYEQKKDQPNRYNERAIMEHVSDIHRQTSELTKSIEEHGQCPCFGMFVLTLFAILILALMIAL